MIEHSLNPLLPLGVLVHQRVPQPDLGAQIEDVIGRDPRLRQPPGHQQLAMMTSVRTVGLRTLLVPAQRRGLRRLGEMHHGADRAQLLDHKAPPGRRLERDLQLLASEPPKEPTHPGPIRRTHPRTADLTAHKIDPLSGHLRPMLVKTHHDRHQPNLHPRHEHHPAPDPSNTLAGWSVPSVERPAARLQSARAYQCCSTRRPGHPSRHDPPRLQAATQT